MPDQGCEKTEQQMWPGEDLNGDSGLERWGGQVGVSIM